MINQYAMSYVCLDCCKSFMRKLPKPIREPEVMPCPDCGNNSYNFGRHFKPPKKSDKKQWQKIRYLFDYGFRFQKIRNNPNDAYDTVPYPENLAQAREFVVKYGKFSINSGSEI
jgi:DNA-directed RNA polymerase subunit RPC12/RpoP